MDGIDDDLFQMDSFDSSDNNSEDYSPKKVQEILEKICEDIPVTFDSSSDKNLIGNNASDYHNPRLDTVLCLVFSFQVFNFRFRLLNFSTKVLLFTY